jgi:integrase
MMPTMKLTDAFLRKVERPEGGVVKVWDTEIRGFSAHVQKTTTTLYYERNNQRHLIGRYPTVSMPQAREAARELDYRLRRGFAKHLTRSNPTLGELVDQYVARPSLRSEKWKTFVRHAIESDLKWGKRRATDVTPALCRDAHKRLLKRGPTAANQILQALNTVWSYAKRQDPSLPDPPTNGMEWYPEAKTLNAPIRDLVAWREAVEQIDNPIHRKAYLFALFTGLRRSEIENLEWDRTDDAIHLPTTKSGREFWLPLVEEHHRLLDPVRGLDDRWVFPADSKSGHIVAWDHDHVPGTLHSLRHTFATVAVEAGIPEEVVGRLLNHASKTITGQRYVRPNLDFMRSAMQIATNELRRRLQYDQLPRFKGQDQATPIYPNS